MKLKNYNKRLRILLFAINNYFLSDIKELLGEIFSFEPEFTEVFEVSEALDLLQTRDFDLLFYEVSSINLAEIQPLAEIHHYHKYLPKIVVGDFENASLRAIAYQNGAHDYFVKSCINKVLFERSVYYAYEKKSLSEEIFCYKRQAQTYNQNFKNIIDQSPNGILIVNSEGMVVFTNPAVENLFKRRSEEILRQPFGFPLANGNKDEIDIIAKDGTIVTALMNVVSAEWDNEPCFLVNLIDISENKKLEKELIDHKNILERTIQDQTERLYEYSKHLKHINLELNKSKQTQNDFIHTLKQELHKIPVEDSDLLNLLSEENKKASTSESSYTNLIKNSGEHLLDLVNDMLDIAMIDSGKFRLSIEHFSPVDVVEEVLTLMLKEFNYKNISIKTNYIGLIPHMYCDKKRFKQVLFNLLSNSIKQADDNEEIIIDIEQKGNEEVQFSVRAGGFCLEPTSQPSRFNDLYTTVDFDDDLGIGLGLSKRLIDLLEGKLYTLSNNNSGSGFYFLLPIRKLKDSNIIVDSSSLYKARNKKILVVDDNDVNLGYITECLQLFDHKVLLAKNGKNAIDVAVKEKPDLILIDTSMPVVNAQDAAEIIRSFPELETVPIIALEVKLPSDKEETLLSSRYETLFDDIIFKPLNATKIFNAINKQFDKSTTSMSSGGDHGK